MEPPAPRSVMPDVLARDRHEQDGFGAAGSVAPDHESCSVQTGVGLLCVVLGVGHFTTRDHHHGARSFYLNSLAESSGARALLATVEVAVGFVLLFAA